MPAATTDVEICNLALSRVGVRRKISELSEDNDEARECSTWYQPSLTQVLEEYPWHFATRRAVLGLTAETRSDWTYVYTLPADCLIPRRIILAGARSLRPDQLIAFNVELNEAGTGQVLLTDQADAELHYTADIEDVGLFTGAFVDALAYRLAANLVIPLQAKPELETTLLQKYLLALGKAQTDAARRGQADAQPEAELITVRG